MSGGQERSSPPHGPVQAGGGSQRSGLNVPVVLRVLGRRRAFRQRDRWTRAQLQAHQARALQQLRDHAYAHSLFYRRFHAGMSDRPLHQLPVLTKATLMEHFDELVTDPAVTLADVEAHLAALQGNERFRGRYWVAATSGTTGQHGIFLWDLEEWVEVLASYNRSLDWVDATAGLTRRLRMAVVSTNRPGSEPPSAAPGSRPCASTPGTRWSASSRGWTGSSRRCWWATPPCCGCWPPSSSPAA